MCGYADNDVFSVGGVFDENVKLKIYIKTWI